MFAAFRSIGEFGISSFHSAINILTNIPLIAFFVIVLVVIPIVFALFDSFRS